MRQTEKGNPIGNYYFALKRGAQFQPLVQLRGFSFANAAFHAPVTVCRSRNKEKINRHTHWIFARRRHISTPPKLLFRAIFFKPTTLASSSRQARVGKPEFSRTQDKPSFRSSFGFSCSSLLARRQCSMQSTSCPKLQFMEKRERERHARISHNLANSKPQLRSSQAEQKTVPSPFCSLI